MSGDRIVAPVKRAQGEPMKFWVPAGRKRADGQSRCWLPAPAPIADMAWQAERRNVK